MVIKHEITSMLSAFNTNYIMIVIIILFWVPKAWAFLTLMNWE